MPSGKLPARTRGRDRHVVAVLVLPDSVALDVTVVQQVFDQRTMPSVGIACDSDSPYEVVLCGEQRRHVLPSGADLGVLAALNTLATADTVMVPGVVDPFARRSTHVLEALRSAHAAGARMVAFGGGAFLFGDAGILDRCRVTTHWLLSEQLRRRFPLARLETGRLHVQDGLVHTSSGGLSTTDLALKLVAADRGQAYARELGQILVSGPPRSGVHTQIGAADDEQPMGSFMHWLRAHLHEPLTMARLAEHAHLSERSLIRKFRRATGMSVFEWISRERIGQAMILLETTDYRVSEIAVMVGFGSPETLRRHFERHTGISAGNYRAGFRSVTPF